MCTRYTIIFKCVNYNEELINDIKGFGKIHINNNGHYILNPTDGQKRLILLSWIVIGQKYLYKTFETGGRTDIGL